MATTWDLGPRLLLVITSEKIIGWSHIPHTSAGM